MNSIVTFIAGNLHAEPASQVDRWEKKWRHRLLPVSSLTLDLVPRHMADTMRTKWRNFPLNIAVGAASQWWSNEQMMVHFKLVNHGERSVWSYTHFTIIKSFSPSLTSILPSLAWSIPSFAHSTIIEKLHRLHRWQNISLDIWYM